MPMTQTFGGQSSSREFAQVNTIQHERPRGRCSRQRRDGEDDRRDVSRDGRRDGRREWRRDGRQDDRRDDKREGRRDS